MKKVLFSIFISALVIGLLGGLGYLWFDFLRHQSTEPDITEITSFEECEAAGYPVMESYPRQCRAGDRTFTEIIQAESPSLTSKMWMWMGTQTDTGKMIKPAQSGAFTVSFSDDGRVSLKTDCNSMGGGYKVEGDKIIFSEVVSTMIYCEDSQESEFSVFLHETPSYRLIEAGELIFEMESGTMYLR
ncbi:MAG: META domain-containing protein [Candidatus Colwellbacteria bacterium]|nr:META domain-containing protein [Candidatus Colwellbacteria bacterium]